MMAVDRALLDSAVDAFKPVYEEFVRYMSHPLNDDKRFSNQTDATILKYISDEFKSRAKTYERIFRKALQDELFKRIKPLYPKLANIDFSSAHEEGEAGAWFSPRKLEVLVSTIYPVWKEDVVFGIKCFDKIDGDYEIHFLPFDDIRKKIRKWMDDNLSPNFLNTAIHEFEHLDQHDRVSGIFANRSFSKGRSLIHSPNYDDEVFDGWRQELKPTHRYTLHQQSPIEWQAAGAEIAFNYIKVFAPKNENQEYDRILLKKRFPTEASFIRSEDILQDAKNWLGNRLHSDTKFSTTDDDIGARALKTIVKYVTKNLLHFYHDGKYDIPSVDNRRAEFSDDRAIEKLNAMIKNYKFSTSDNKISHPLWKFLPFKKMRSRANVIDKIIHQAASSINAELADKIQLQTNNKLYVIDEHSSSVSFGEKYGFKLDKMNKLSGRRAVYFGMTLIIDDTDLSEFFRNDHRISSFINYVLASNETSYVVPMDVQRRIVKTILHKAINN